MANDTLITVVGNLDGRPQSALHQQRSGRGRLHRCLDSAGVRSPVGRLEGRGETLFLRCTAWREYAENIADSLSKGMRVIVQGRLVQRNWERDGQTRTSYELQIEEVGPALRYAKAQVTCTPPGRRLLRRSAHGRPRSGSQGQGRGTGTG